MTDAYKLPEDHPPLKGPRLGVLLINLGTPDATDYASMRRYLGQFLSDRRVIELSPWLWQPILQLIVLSVRPKKSGRAYDKIWDREKNESPLKTITRNQAEALGAAFSDHPRVIVEWAMRYGHPAIGDKLTVLEEAGCDKILLMPLYPQYSAATTASANDEAFRHLMTRRWQPAVRTLAPYHDAPGYIAALRNSVERHLQGLDWKPQKLLASFHGLPRENLDKGDPYHCQCQKTGRLLREALDWPEEDFIVTFQSRFGPKEWLQPYSDETVAQLGDEGVKKMAIISPGFSADCLETLEEVALGLHETFEEHGGESFTYIPCLNEEAEHIAFLKELAISNLRAWL